MALPGIRKEKTKAHLHMVRIMGWKIANTFLWVPFPFGMVAVHLSLKLGHF
jgi:hypothetical protein